MKKILMILGLMGLLNAAAVRAQAPETAQVQQDSLIAVDTVLKGGIRFIQSRDFEIYRGWTTGAAFNLSYADRPGDTTPYRLDITFAETRFTMKAGETKLLLKLKKTKTVLELINTRNIGPSDYRSELSKDGTYYYITPSFAISEAQIRQIAADKVAKLRLIYDQGKFDREIQNNAAAVGFRSAYAAIQERLQATAVAPPAEEPAMIIEAKPEEEESYGYIVDEEDESYVAPEEAADSLATEEAVETETVDEAESTEAEAVIESTIPGDEASEEAVEADATETVSENTMEATDTETVETDVTTSPTEEPETVEAKATEPIETAETTEITDTVETVETVEPTETAETTESVETTEVQD